MIKNSSSSPPETASSSSCSTPSLIGVGIWATVRTPLDAIPDVSDNQVIVYVDWPGRSPQLVEDQVTYPLASNLQGLPNLKAVRAQSMFGFSLVYVIFDDDVDIYWARTRVLERLNYVSALLPAGVTPRLGPEGTGVGHVFWYTLQSKNHDLGELRSIQDWYLKLGLQSVDGVAEVASVGGFVKQYQVNLDPIKMAARNVSLDTVVEAVRRSNNDVGGRPESGRPPTSLFERRTASIDGVERDVARGHLDRVEIDLVLLDESADARNLGHAVDGLQAELQIPVLDRAELAEVVVLRLQRVPEHVAHARPLGAEARRDAGGQQGADVVQPLEHARARPVDVDVVVEDDVDEREPEHRLRAHGLQVRQSLQVRRERIRDLILDELRRAPRPVDVDDDLVVGDVGNGIERRAHRRPDADADDDRVEQQDDEAVAGGEVDEFAIMMRRTIGDEC